MKNEQIQKHINDKWNELMDPIKTILMRQLQQNSMTEEIFHKKPIL